MRSADLSRWLDGASLQLLVTALHGFGGLALVASTFVGITLGLGRGWQPGRLTFAERRTWSLRSFFSMRSAAG